MSIVRFTGILHRLANVSPSDFSALWANHAALAAPWFLYHNVRGYTQTHATASAAIPGAKVVDFDGMVELYFDPSTCTLFNPKLLEGRPDSEGAQKYFEEVIFVDEKRFWDRTEQANVRKGVEWQEGTMGFVGKEVKVIVDGKVVVDVPDELWKRWQSYVGGHR